ncbi:hypothetical protein PybrP1_001485 [[Pythium] brassicae (nom. inval.)]|nr:hypothetical protein PybrP1_001485 [[Pythium] brassicae (nom. inval.)]
MRVAAASSRCYTVQQQLARWRLSRRLLQLLLALLLLLTLTIAPGTDAALTATRVTPASLTAGVRTDALVAFTSIAELPIGSQLRVTFPSGFLVATNSVQVTIDNAFASTLTLATVSATSVAVTLGSAPAPANQEFKFTITDITNPAAQTTNVFTIEAIDGSGVMTDADVNVAGVTIVSTALSAASVSPESLEAGVAAVTLGFDTKLAAVLNELSLDLITTAGVPKYGFVVVGLPPQIVPPSKAIVLEETSAGLLVTGSVTEFELWFQVPALLSAGSYSFSIRGIRNPGVTTTGSFKVSTADSRRRLIETGGTPGFSTSTGVILNAQFVPLLPHPGIPSKVQVSFVTSAQLDRDSLIQIELPSGDYAAALPASTVVIDSPAGITAIVSWDGPASALLVLITSAISIPQDSAVAFTVSVLQMPSSVRTQTAIAAVIHTWNGAGLQLDGPNIITLAAVTAVDNLLNVWKTTTANPGIVTNAEFTFNTNGMIPVGGQIIVVLPAADFLATDGPIAVSFSAPGIMVAASVWEGASRSLIVTLGGAGGITAYSTKLAFTISALTTPASVRVAGRAGAFLVTKDAQGGVIDGPSPVAMDAISAGLVLGPRTWVPAKPYAGVTSDQTLEFFNSGKIPGGGFIEITMPNEKWSMAATATATVSTPALGASSAAVAWNPTTRIVSIALPASATIIPSSVVTVRIPAMSNPPKETGFCDAFLATKAPDGLVIDGPGAISVMNIAKGAVGGLKTWTSEATNSASMRSDQTLRVTLSGALPSGSFLILSLPGEGWRFASQTPVAAFPASTAGVSVKSVVWTSLSSELQIETLGDLVEGAVIEILVKDMINPYDEQSSAALKLTTTLAGAGVVDASDAIMVNAIASSVLPQSGAWTSVVATPGVEGTQLISLTTGGRLEAGATICVSLAAANGWTVSFAATSTMSVDVDGVFQSSPVTMQWDADTRMLCLVAPTTIEQVSNIEFEITKVRSPPSETVEQSVGISIRSHLGGLVNTGSVIVNAIAKGSLAGSLLWASLQYDPGPVAGLLTSAVLAFRSTGQVLAGGRIVLLLPIEWVLEPTCAVTFRKPPVAGTAVCKDNLLKVTLADALDQYTDVEVLVMGMRNPPSVQPKGVAALKTIASDGGLIDDSALVAACAIESALLTILSSGGARAAVVGVKKTFRFDGFNIAEGDVVKFVDASTTSDLNCGSTVGGVSDAGGLDIATVSAVKDAQFTFTQSSLDGRPFRVCYKFGSNPFKLYPNLAFTVKEILSVSSDVGVPTIAVANYAKTWTFSGNGIDSGDQARWISLEAVEEAVQSSATPDCTDVSTLAKLVPIPDTPLLATEDEYTRDVALPGNAAALMFDKANSGKTFCLCYKFGKEPFAVYPAIRVQVNHLTTIKATTSGRDTVAVVGAAKEFTFVGDGLLANDRAYFVEAGSTASCAESSANPDLRVAHTISKQSQTVLFLADALSTSVNFNAAAAGKKVVPCYQFGAEPYQFYPGIRVEVKMVSRFVGNVGSPLFAVALVPEPLTFVGSGLEAGDQVRWVMHGEEDCDSNLASLLASDTATPVDTTPLDAGLSGVFNFAEAQTDYNPQLCYRFGDEEFKLYTGLAIKIGTVRAKATVTGDREVAVVAARKLFTLSGMNLAENDRVGWTTSASSDCSRLSLLVPPNVVGNLDNDYLSFTTAQSEFGVALAALSSGKRVYMCYGFDKEPLKMYASLFLDVKSIVNMRALIGSNRAAVSGALKAFLFDGDGVANGDFAKFVPSESLSCDQPGISLVNIMKEFDDYGEMAMYLYESIGGVTVGSFQFASDAASAGLARVLCYRFGREPFFFYKNFNVDVKTIWALRQVNKLVAGGQDYVAVVNDRKLVSIDGVGVSERDQVKFVTQNAASDQNCADFPAQGLLLQEIKVFANGSMWYPFEYSSNGSKWRLCYKFDEEPYRLYPSVEVSVKQVVDLADFSTLQTLSLGRVATIGQLKTWMPLGAGVQAGDTVKFVSLSVLSSVDCGAANTNTAGGSSVMTVTTNSVLTPVFSGVFTEFPAAPSDVYHLCYKFQDEPFSYVRGFELRTFGVLSIDRSSFLAEASTPLQVSGFRLSSVDQLGWTTSISNCSNAFAVTDVVDQRSIVYFAKDYAKLFLCYSFDRQPFSLFSNLPISVVQAEVWVPKTTSVIASQEVVVTVAGTFGLTASSDQIAWVPSDAIACSPDVLEMYTSVMVSSVTSTTRSQSLVARGGAATLSVKFVPPASTALATSASSASWSTWKLCYRFGNMASYLMFSNVLCDVLNIEQVTLLLSDAGELGSMMTFQFNGVGTQDFDTAKWVAAADAATDADCDALPPVGGSQTGYVISQRASFTFVKETVGMVLCYKFQGHAFKLFAGVPIRDLSASVKSGGASSAAASSSSGQTASGLEHFDDEREAASSGVLTPNRDVATVALKLDMDINSIPPNSPAETQFKNDFLAALKMSLGIDAARIQILELLEGSVIVKFQLLPSENAADPLVNEVVRDLQTQLTDPKSELLKRDVIAVAEPQTALSVSVATPAVVASPAASAVSLQARGYQRSGLFTFVKSVYSVTERSGTLQVPVVRLQGVDGVITLIVRLDPAKQTATYGVDYRIPMAASESSELVYLRFEIGESVKTIEVEILDDVVKEPHFEFFTIRLQEPETPGCAIGGTPETTVRVYDYGDGVELIRHRFPVLTGAKGDVRGWRAVANGDGAARTDGGGLFAADAVFGESEYDQKCDFAAPTGECDFACSSSGDAALVSSSALAARNVLELSGDDYVASVSSVNGFPSVAFTLSLWVKTAQRAPTACIASYAVTSESSAVPLALCNPSNVELLLNSRVPSEKLSTFVDISDNAWHFLAVTWSAEDGRVFVYDSAMLVFDGGPFQVGDVLQRDGVFVLGGFVASSSPNAPCSVRAEPSVLAAAASAPPTVACRVQEGSGFVGSVQHVHLWSRVISRSEMLKELAWPQQVATNGLAFGWNFDAAYLSGDHGTTVGDISTNGQAKKNPGFVHCAAPPQSLATLPQCVVSGVLPSLYPGFPCSQVYANIWHFAAPPDVVQKLRVAYGGRLQYEMLAPSFNGAPRPRRGQLSIFDGSGRQMSLALGSFALPTATRWTSYSAILREDFGWISEPSGTPLSADEFQEIVADASALWIRGDLWGADSNGQGQEAVYLNDIAVFAR